MMRTSENGVALIKRFEGLELEAYRDIAGVWTIGYGFTGRYPDWLRAPGGLPAAAYVGAGQSITGAQAERLLTDALKSREANLNGWMITNGVDLNRNEYDALISFIYNVGFGAFKGSTAARWLREGKPREEVAEALTWWNKATVGGSLREVTGLTRRRAAERDLFLTPPDIAPAETPPLAAYDFAADYPDTAHRVTNACPACEQRPLNTYLPKFLRELCTR